MLLNGRFLFEKPGAVFRSNQIKSKAFTGEDFAASLPLLSDERLFEGLCKQLHHNVFSAARPNSARSFFSARA